MLAWTHTWLKSCIFSKRMLLILFLLFFLKKCILSVKLHLVPSVFRVFLWSAQGTGERPWRITFSISVESWPCRIFLPYSFSLPLFYTSTIILSPKVPDKNKQSIVFSPFSPVERLSTLNYMTTHSFQYGELWGLS